MLYRVRDGHFHGRNKSLGPGSLVELTEAEAGGFLDKLEPAPETATETATETDGGSTWEHLSHVLPARAIEALEAAGYTPETAAAAADEDLIALKGIGPLSLKAIRDNYGQ